MPSLRSLLQQLGNWFTGSHRHDPEPFVYVAMGDSTVEGIGASHHSRSYASLIYADLLRTYPTAQYHNLGKRGARLHEVYAQQLPAAVPYKPQLITISVGANDVVRRTSLSTFRRDLHILLEALHTQTNSHVFITTIPDFSFHHRIPKTLKPAVWVRIRQYNTIIRQVARTSGAHVVDTFNRSAVLTQRFPEALSNDKFHPSDLGYVLWANVMLDEIHKQLRPKRWRLPWQ